MNKIVPIHTLTITLILIVCSLACKDSTTEEDLECFRCTYSNNLPSSCDMSLVYEVCILRPHEQSLQDVLEVKEICNGQEQVSEEIQFMEAFLDERMFEGASCEEF